MKTCLIDTNVISELARPKPDRNVIAFLSSLENAALSIISLHEIQYGIGLLPPGQRRAELEQQMARLLSEYGDSIIPVDEREAAYAASLRVQTRQQGKTLHLADSLIAGTAAAHNMTIATRNTPDFDGIGVELVNPWEERY
ncbi:MAG TPA: type II toxin-antitoxin system VapC family toxin [Gammaproteobacteria bacterium]|nr:type II toxin-antitoxin system VapC family toxin [Gammaproteobacteria bacterium]